MFLIEDELLEYAIGGATFFYERLIHDDLAKLRYLANIRGQFSDETYDKACIATALRGWEGLNGKDGPILWPLAMPVSAIGGDDQSLVERLAALMPTMTREQRMHLHGALYVVNHLPIDVVPQLKRLVTELSPETLEKKHAVGLNGNSSGATHTLDSNLPAPIAENRNAEGSPATAEA